MQLFDGEFFILINIIKMKAIGKKAPTDIHTKNSGKSPPQITSLKSSFVQMKNGKFGFGREFTVKYYPSTQRTL